MAHGFFLRLGRNDLFGAGRGGGGLALDLVGQRVQFGFAHALVLELQRVAHLGRFQLFGQQLVHAAAVLLGQLHLADLHGAQQQAVGRHPAAQFGLNRGLDFSAFGGEDLAHRVARQHFVDHALHRGLHHLRANVFGQVLGHRGDLGGVQRIAHRQVDAEGQAFHRLKGRLSRLRAVDLVAQRELANFVQAGQHPHRTFAKLGCSTSELVGAHRHVTTRHAVHRWMGHQRPGAGGGDAQGQPHAALAHQHLRALGRTVGPGRFQQLAGVQQDLVQGLDETFFHDQLLGVGAAHSFQTPRSTQWPRQGTLHPAAEETLTAVLTQATQ